MASFSPLVNGLADRLARMGVRSLVYFHTDHFEPWRNIGDKVPAVGHEIVDSIDDFVRACERIDFARRLTLFYKPHLNYALSKDRELTRAHPDDLVGFLSRTEPEERFGRAAMQNIASRLQHEFQLHVHHEYYTATTIHADPIAIEWFAGPLGRKLDASRLELALRLNREIIIREVGRFPDEWFFVHGQWGLNGSDAESCTIDTEIDVLLRNGCRGDFTFPAARAVVNPRIQAPYFCRPVDAPKGYDRPEAEPEPAAGNSDAATHKFFIWACAASSLQCSIDYMSKASTRHLANTEKAAKELIDGSYCNDGILYIKTHAHSMHQTYFEHARMPVFPHQYPATQTMLSVIFDAAARAGAEVRFSTASEVYKSVVQARANPATDLVETYLRRSGPIEVVKEWTSARTSGKRAKTNAAGPAIALNMAAQIEVIREAVASVLRPRIERLGVDGSGAFQHYNAMLARGFPLPDYELAALEIVRNNIPDLDAYYEIGSGLGTLSFLLALNGFPSVGVEFEKGRHETAVAAWSGLVARLGIDRHLCRLVQGVFPKAVATDDVSRSVAILTDFVTTQTPHDVRTIYEGLSRYRYVLVDLQRFLVKRERAEEREELLDDFRSRGFLLGDRVSDPLMKDYSFVLLENAVSHRGNPLLRVFQSWRPVAVRTSR